MDGQIRVSVRSLVEFSIHGEDIFPVSSKQDMAAGTKGHKARQGKLGEGWQAEVPLSITAEAEGITFFITGRMDAYYDADIPVIEELKLSYSGSSAPQTVQAAHSAQAIVYGHMLCLEKEKEAVRIRVVYVSETGEERAVFEEQRSAKELRAEFDTLLLALARWESIQMQHRAKRNESLEQLPFPFDTYRPGQREMAVQVFTAIRNHKRLFASMPTGTGKSAAVLYPSLKALGRKMTGQIFYLTARTTARQAALQALDFMREKGMHVRSLTLNAKDKQCPGFTRCHPDICPRAKGHFVRLPDALTEMMERTDWNAGMVADIAEKYSLCPFEFALSLCEIADVVICDYNYAFDPAVRIRRIFEWRSDLTLLVDESHNLASRTREMLSGVSDGEFLREYRIKLGRVTGRKSPLYKTLTTVLHVLRSIEMREGQEETVLSQLPDELLPTTQVLLETIMETFSAPPPGEAGQALGELFLMVIGFMAAADRGLENYAILCRRHGREREVKLIISILSALAELESQQKSIAIKEVMLSYDIHLPIVWKIHSIALRFMGKLT